jgi:hypothetical protein
MGNSREKSMSLSRASATRSFVSTEALADASQFIARRIKSPPPAARHRPPLDRLKRLTEAFDGKLDIVGRPEACRAKAIAR